MKNRLDFKTLKIATNRIRELLNRIERTDAILNAAYAQQDVTPMRQYIQKARRALLCK